MQIAASAPRASLARGAPNPIAVPTVPLPIRSAVIARPVARARPSAAALSPAPLAYRNRDATLGTAGGAMVLASIDPGSRSSPRVIRDRHFQDWSERP
jgi:hypothetical protein